MIYVRYIHIYDISVVLVFSCKFEVNQWNLEGVKVQLDVLD